MKMPMMTRWTVEGVGNNWETTTKMMMMMTVTMMMTSIRLGEGMGEDLYIGISYRCERGVRGGGRGVAVTL